MSTFTYYHNVGTYRSREFQIGVRVEPNLDVVESFAVVLFYEPFGEVESVRDLARRVERDKAQVSRDLRVLAEHAIVNFEENGRAKRPYLQSDHLVVEPIY